MCANRIRLVVVVVCTMLACQQGIARWPVLYRADGSIQLASAIDATMAYRRRPTTTI